MIEQIFTAARTYPNWQEKPVSQEVLQQLYDCFKYAPTSMNCCPMRLLFVTSAQGKEKLVPCVSEGNVAKVQAAPVTAICAFDQRYYEQMPYLWQNDGEKIAKRLSSAPDQGEGMGMFNASLQAGYFILAARAVGLDCGPMAGFSKDKVNDAFLSDAPRAHWRSIMLCNIGYGDSDSLHPRQQRLAFEDACQLT